MVQNLSSQVYDSSDPISALVPTSQHGGNQVSANHAQTAPGGASGDLGSDVGTKVVSEAPVVEAITHESPVIIDAAGAKVNADANHARPTLYTKADGSDWNCDPDAAAPVPLSFRPPIRRGEVNFL